MEDGVLRLEKNSKKHQLKVFLIKQVNWQNLVPNFQKEIMKLTLLQITKFSMQLNKKFLYNQFLLMKK